jgi:Flp pilus assembly protein TadD
MDTTNVKAMSLSFAILVALGAGQFLAQATLIEQARAALGRGDSDAAIEILGKAVAQSPKSAEVHYSLGSVYGAKVQADTPSVADRTNLCCRRTVTIP